jgi:hypothetical protein
MFMMDIARCRRHRPQCAQHGAAHHLRGQVTAFDRRISGFRSAPVPIAALIAAEWFECRNTGCRNTGRRGAAPHSSS